MSGDKTEFTTIIHSKWELIGRIMDRLEAMRLFVRVVETSSFSAVARELGSTQSAVSKQIAALEGHLGARLLTRSTRALALTQAGEGYFEQARRLVAEINEAEGAVRSGETQLKGTLRVASSVAFARLKLLPLVHSFLALHPDVRIDLRLSDALVDLVEEGIDVSVRIGELADSTLVAKRIGSTQRVLVASRDYLRQLPAGLTAPRCPQDLLAHQCVVYTGSTASSTWTFVAGPGATVPVGHVETVRVTGHLTCNSSEIVREAVVSGIGIGNAPGWFFSEELATGKLQILLPDWPSPPMPIHLVSPKDRRQSAKVRAFGEHVAAQLKVG
jgi:DNA-binding transcriptional LysR family regulator